jgi:serine/threonine-protein kinase
MDRKLDPSVAETIASASLASASLASHGAPEISRISSAVAEDEGRFVPGTLLGGRYRIIGLLGRGGMGEVYRATDLTLGQSVALKFLPEEAARNQRLLERFHGEVRVARLVSHPNVCRVYDIGEVEGMPFISMEYVDGEDLASLLLRIGRLPADKALETARKLCAGLAAAHDRGVIHRDLKPQNIMMNKRGEVLIMDFGLAAIADQLVGAEVRNGTPAYMSPEQLKGAGVTARSDIYALGLVLYELLTGKRPYEANSLQQLIDLQDSARLTNMTSVAADIDPAVEKIVRRCLEPDPARRPAGALAVAAALPGGDPLAAALAAGETPSPEMVAAAGDTEGLARKYSVPCLLLIAACLMGAVAYRQYRTAMMRAPLDNPPEVLAHKSRELAVLFGYPKRPADQAIWLGNRPGLVGYLNGLPAPRKWDEWLAADAPIQSTYRESPEPLYAHPEGDVSDQNPPPVLPGMVQVILDGHGRLLYFSAVPYGVAEEFAPPVQPDAVFRAAWLDMARFTETAPSPLPPSASDRVRAWKGPHPKIPNTELTVEIASWKGRITRAQLLYPYSRSGGGQGPSVLSKLRDYATQFLTIVGAFFIALLAQRNWKLERADRQGARRVAAAHFLFAMVAWIGFVHPVPTQGMKDLFLNGAAQWLLWAAIIWILYLALEPAVRARWPHAMVTWNRALAGRWLDAQVASHILIGAALGSAVWMALKLLNVWLAVPWDRVNTDVSLRFALGTTQWIGGHADQLRNALWMGLVIFMAIFGLRRMLRYDMLAALAASLLFTMMEGEVVHSADWQLMTLIFVGLYMALIFVLLRLGLVAIISSIFFANCFNALLLGSDWKAWYAPSGIATMSLMLGIATFAFWRSLGSRELLAGEDPAAAS